MVTPFQEAATQVKGLLKADGRILRERWIFPAIVCSLGSRGSVSKAASAGHFLGRAARIPGLLARNATPNDILHTGGGVMEFSKRAAVSGLVLSSILCVGAIGCASSQSTHMGRAAGSETGAASSVTSSDSNFARNACESSAAEIQMSQLAAANTKTKEVRSFARKLASDHQRAEKELSGLFTRKQIPAENELNMNYQTSLDELARLKGGNFDQAFKDDVIRAHENAIAALQKEASEGSDPDLRAFAQKRLPELQRHLQIARTLPVSSDTEGPKATPDVGHALSDPGARGVTSLR
jgi:putative membrane protein